MATKTKLEQAVEAQAKELSAAERELVMAQLSTYMWNKRRMGEIEDQIKLIALKPADEPKNIKAQVSLRKQLMSERHQLTTENISITTKLLMKLKGTGEKGDELDEFLKGQR